MGRKGNTEPRFFIPPLRELTPETSLGFEVIEFAELLGVELYPWQRWALIHGLELLPNGEFRFKRVIIEVSRQNGKALDVATPVLTTAGWSTMGELKRGDEVFHPDGTPTRVDGAFDVMHDHKCYEVETVDGRKIVADEDHLWTVQDLRRTKRKGRRGERPVRWHEWETITTREMVERGIMRGPREGAFRLPRQQPLLTPEVDLPIDPYLLGLWLGDGSSRSAEIWAGDGDVAETVANIEATGARIVSQYRDRTAWKVRFSIGGESRKGAQHQLNKLGLLQNKHIPPVYLTAGTEQREALLQGLLDSDGTISKAGQVEFTSVKRALADDTLYLIRSLGWRATVKEAAAKIYGRDCGTRFRVMFTPSTADDYRPFRMVRKAERVRSDLKTRGDERNCLTIRNIREVPSRPVRCIKVDREDGLFLAGRGLMPTHNTLLMVVLGLWRMFQFGASRVLSSAQSLGDAEDTLDEAFAIAAWDPVLRAFLPDNPRAEEEEEDEYNGAYRARANGKAAMELSIAPVPEVLDLAGKLPIWSLAVTSRKGGRSKSVDLALMDELRELLDWAAWNGIVPTTTARPKSQVWGFSNAGDPRSVVLRSLRDSALIQIDQAETEGTRTAFFSWSAEPEADILDPDAHAAANPSMGYQPALTAETMMADARDAANGDEAAGWCAEHLCQWPNTLIPGKISASLWESLEDPASQPQHGAEVFVGVEVALDGRFAHIAICSKRDDGAWHVEIVASRAGFRWVPDWLTARKEAADSWFSGEVGMQVKGAPSTALAPLLREAGIEIAEWQGADMSGSVLGYVDRIRERGVFHRPQPVLNASLDGAVTRKRGGTEIWDREKSATDAGPTIATNIAWWMATRTDQDTFVSAYSADDWDDEELGLTHNEDGDDFSGLMFV